MIAGFRKTGISPVDKSQVLSRLPQSATSGSGTGTRTAATVELVSQSFIEHLTAARHGSNDKGVEHARRRKVLGFVENFSRAMHACELCMVTQDDMQRHFRECELQSRTPELYDKQVKDLATDAMSVSDCGLKRPSVLGALPYYHPVCNDATDIMHDLFEGVLPLETKLFVCHLLFEVKCITLSELNNRIKVADFGQLGGRSKPSALLESHIKSMDGKLGQRSAQMVACFVFCLCWLLMLCTKLILRN